MDKLLTIIVPTYNMEVYLDRCLTSLIVGEPNSELMRMLEVLVINDGSTDRTSEIAHGYETRYPDTFRVIDKDNGAYGSCINVALPLMSGKYVKVLDADDFFDNVNFVKYMTFLQRVDVDMVCSAYERVNIQNETLDLFTFDIAPNEVFESNENIPVLIRLIMHSVAYRTALFKGLNYHQTEGIYYTDMEWVYLPLARVKTFMYFPEVLYRHFIGRPGQSMEPTIYLKNYEMRITGILVYIAIYETCLCNVGKWNGISVNMEFLRTRCMLRTEEFYFDMLSKSKDEVYVLRLRHFDDVVRARYPNFYKELDKVKHHNPHIPQFQLPLRFIHCWHKHGTKAAAVQVRIINHTLGLSARLVKLFVMVRKATGTAFC